MNTDKISCYLSVHCEIALVPEWYTSMVNSVHQYKKGIHLARGPWAEG